MGGFFEDKIIARRTFNGWRHLFFPSNWFDFCPIDYGCVFVKGGRGEGASRSYTVLGEHFEGYFDTKEKFVNARNKPYFYYIYLLSLFLNLKFEPKKNTCVASLTYLGVIFGGVGGG